VCLYEEALRELKPDLNPEQLRGLAWEALGASKGSGADSLMPPLHWQPSIPVMQLRQEGLPAPARAMAVSEYNCTVFPALSVYMACADRMWCVACTWKHTHM
jgi:hypothetical protein